MMKKDLTLIPTIRIKRESMTSNEQRVVDWILDPQKFYQASSLKEIALVLDLSEALIVKVAKTLGFKGFRELRQQLMLYFEQHSVDTVELVETDSPQDLVNKVFNISLQTVTQGQSILNAELIRQAGELFFQAQHRELYAVGGSKVICEDIAHKFLRIGVRCNLYHDAHLMMMSASLLSDNDVVLVVSHSGRTKDLLKVVEKAKENGAKVICITHNDISPIALLADFVICTPAPNTPLLGKNASARILQLVLVDALFMSVAQQFPDFAQRNLERTHSATKYFRQK